MLTGTLLANLGEFATGPRVRINPRLKHILGEKFPPRLFRCKSGRWCRAVIGAAIRRRPWVASL